MIEINKEFQEMLMLAPIGYFAFGFWMFSNRQIFANEVKKIKTMEDSFETNHFLIPCLFGELSPGHLYLIFLIVALLLQTNKAQDYIM